MGWQGVLALELETDMSDAAAAETKAEAEEVGMPALGGRGVGDGQDRAGWREAAGGTRRWTKGCST